ncbi:ribosome small subunit-dependent GTPase A [Cryobacterium sp. Y57]|uniref:ribosome small subunit-dependent GTPase A n=1 Tax=Cryobacterium sp. Y57 TaxID=2048287 RepID=UPI00351AA3B8
MQCQPYRPLGSSTFTGGEHEMVRGSLSDSFGQLGWTASDDATFVGSHPGAVLARVIIAYGNRAEVAFSGGLVNEDTHLATGLNFTPVAGDWVAVRSGQIVAVSDRRTAITRPDPDGTRTQVLAANVDTVLIVVAIDHLPSLRAIERLQVMAWDSGAIPLLVLTKADAHEDPEEMLEFVAPVAVGIETFLTSTRDGLGLDALRDRISVGTTTMLGASGAGKTSLLNAMEGTHAATADVGGDGQGRHTTTTRRLYPMQNGGVMLDVPGIRSLSLHATDAGMAETFTEIAQASKRCRFRDCSHDGDAGCAIAAAVISGEISARRLESWRAVQRELSHHDRRHDPAAMAEQQKQWKQMTKASRKRR